MGHDDRAGDPAGGHTRAPEHAGGPGRPGPPRRFPARCGRSAYAPSSTTCTSSSPCCPRATPSWARGAARAAVRGGGGARTQRRGRVVARRQPGVRVADHPLGGAGHGGAAQLGRADRAAARVPQRGGAGAAGRRQGAHRPRLRDRRRARGVAARPGAGAAAALPLRVRRVPRVGAAAAQPDARAVGVRAAGGGPRGAGAVAQPRRRGCWRRRPTPVAYRPGGCCSSC